MIAVPWRARLFAIAAGIAGVWLGFQLATGNFAGPGLCAGVLGLFLLSRLQPLPIGTLLLGLVTAGYIVGNRGFAQVMVTNLPILPAEAMLAFGGMLLLIQSAWRRELPVRWDALHLALLVWIALGALRIAFDFRSYGFMAVRDFATVYYALFFFLGRELAREERGRRFFETIVMVSAVALLPLFFLYDRFASFFLEVLTWRGNPLIFYKGDLAGTCMGVGSVLFYVRSERQARRFNLAISLVLAAGVLASGNRASMLGLVVATGWLAVRGHWRFAIAQAINASVLSIAIVVGAALLHIPWEKTPVFGLYERVISVFDPLGHRVYRGEETYNKGDNNIFRSVWWQAVIDETVEENPYVGLGFGRDLAERFVREYYPESSEEFTARSPHNILLTIFARMGAIGLLTFLIVCAFIAARTWRAVGLSLEAAAPWCASWVILTSACFGVVLEGPMGAVVFWTMLGVADASLAAASAEADHASEKPAAPALPSATASV